LSNTTNPGIGSPNSSLTAVVTSTSSSIAKTGMIVKCAFHQWTKLTFSVAKSYFVISAYEYNVMQTLTTIKEQNIVILEWIRKQNAKEFQFKKTDLQLPVEFPLNDEEHLQQLELFLGTNQNFTDLVSISRVVLTFALTRLCSIDLTTYLFAVRILW
jgi:predicted choloylglycine hydrolase